MMSKRIIIFSVASVLGCQTTPPSSFELSKRSGLIETSVHSEADAHLLDRVSLKNPGSSSKAPIRTPPKIAKVWMYDQIINESQWLKGSWIYIETSKSKWAERAPSTRENIIFGGKPKD